MQLSATQGYISLVCVLVFPFGHIGASAAAEQGQGCIPDPMFLSKSHSVKPLWDPHGLLSLIPFHAARMISTH